MSEGESSKFALLWNETPQDRSGQERVIATNPINECPSLTDTFPRRKRRFEDNKFYQDEKK